MAGIAGLGTAEGCLVHRGKRGHFLRRRVRKMGWADFSWQVPRSRVLNHPAQHSEKSLFFGEIENIPIENAPRHGIIKSATASYPMLKLFRSLRTAGTIRIRQG
ncbi:hypothetical protein P9726_00790 [Geobacillus stearothermophilus]|uniref:hypothetical protein n=1 Tax=Geobacillus stearothermophilus TaxID=1422 RepID=UPI001873ACA2|nr:hypothetical protein [Geobacillus stearothermophilus]MED3748868.1 hypothetical protein [Geobacillus stearothermophilus]MED4978287.1 hypothetical protein [Geobacillus stearothermophilus]QOR83948.1 hypothetical protein IMZ17_15745 [Geobacillus stearothermophilus]